MTPQIPGYLLTFETVSTPIVAAIALGLIWMGAARMEAPARSRYATAGALSIALIAWLAVARYLGEANTYAATGETSVPTIMFGLLIPLIVAAIGVRLSENMASLVSAIPLPLGRRGSDLSRPWRHIPSCFGPTDACPGNSRCLRGLVTL